MGYYTDDDDIHKHKDKEDNNWDGIDRRVYHRRYHDEDDIVLVKHPEPKSYLNIILPVAFAVISASVTYILTIHDKTIGYDYKISSLEKDIGEIKTSIKELAKHADSIDLTITDIMHRK